MSADKYPKLYAMVEMMLVDNLGSMRPVAAKQPHEWDWAGWWCQPPAPLDELERQAARLTQRQTETMVYGEHRDQMRLVKRYGLDALHEFLNQVFDGDLSGVVYT